MAEKGRSNLESQEKDLLAKKLGGEGEDDSGGSAEEAPGRQIWDRKIEYLLSLFGYSVGLGNLWRFPYFCARHGGGAFLIPFFIFLFLCGLPLYLLEVSLGQFSGKSPSIVWSVAPLFKGLGLLMVVVSGIVSWYYNTIMAWILYFLVHSFFPKIPWATCDNWWNTDACVLSRSSVQTFNQSTDAFLNNSLLNQSSTMMHNATFKKGNFLNTAAVEFWEYNVLRKSSGLDEPGSMQWHLVAAMAVAWILTFLCLVKGVHSVGKVVYVTVTLPYILLTALLIRGLTLDGSVEGIIHYLKPDFERIIRFEAWKDAALQVFYSLGPAWGGLITMSSYNKFNNRCFRDALYGTLADGLTSFYAGFVVFAFLGYMIKQAGLTMDEVPHSGPGLVFITYPEALVTMPFSHLWSVLFFLMLLTVGIDSQFGMFETLSSGIIDAFPRQLGNKKFLTTAVLCLGLFILSLPFTFNGGYYMFYLIDWYATAFCVMFGSMLECVVIAWVYGAERFSRDIEIMTGSSVGKIVRFAWCIITPIIMVVMLFLNIVGITPPNSAEYTYPGYAHGIGIVLAIIPCLPVPLGMIHSVTKAKGSIYKRITSMMKPDKSWKPNDPQQWECYKVYEYTGSWLQNIRVNLLGDNEHKPERFNLMYDKEKC